MRQGTTGHIPAKEAGPPAGPNEGAVPEPGPQLMNPNSAVKAAFGGLPTGPSPGPASAEAKKKVAPRCPVALVEPSAEGPCQQANVLHERRL